ncbi:MAG: hypothetical protein J3Q66DRAFT_443713 [Benniella sp.]|nr:MAG: hypothetical protein J3Q66DRAFT_443713 [Benniella sp.]
MPSQQHPLELPEILSHVASYVHRRSLPVCARVSKAWHQAFIPFIWEDIHPRYPKYNRPGLEAVRKHCHLVKTLTLDAHNHRNLCSLARYPNLQSLSVSRIPEPTELLLYHHASLLQLTLKNVPIVSGTWATLLQLENLTDLGLYHMEIQETTTSTTETETETEMETTETDMDRFWQLCTRLERLTCFSLDIRCHPGQLFSMTFPRLKELQIRRREVIDHTVFLELMKRCPNLTTCVWATLLVSRHPTPPELVEAMAAKTWPHLHRFHLESHPIYTKEACKIIGGMERITSLALSCPPSALQPETMDHLRLHFAYLTVLRWIWPRAVDDSATAQVILASCPCLVRFSGNWITAATIAKGAPWVCLGLRTLIITPIFDSSTIQDIQPRVFEQIARLERLEVLRLWDPNPRDDFQPYLFQKSVDLRLTYGLGKLSTLRWLRYIAFNFSHQRMGEQEMDWILEHWTSLEMVRGRLDGLDDVVGNELSQRLRDRGIDVGVNTGKGKELYEDVD